MDLIEISSGYLLIDKVRNRFLKLSHEPPKHPFFYNEWERYEEIVFDDETIIIKKNNGSTLVTKKRL